MALHLHTFSAGNDNPALKNAPELRGAMAAIADYYMQNAYLPRKDWAYMFAVVFSSVICARYYDFGGQFSSIYTCLGCESGTGKNSISSIAHDLMKQITKEHSRELVCKISDVSSGAAVHSLIATYPQCLATFDEWGKFLHALKSNAMVSTSQSVFTSAFTDVNGFLSPKLYADLKQNSQDMAKCATIDRPALSLCTFGTPDRIRENITEDEFIDGSYARYCFVELSDNPVRPNEFPSKKPLNEEILQLIRRVLLFKIEGHNANSEAARFKLQRDIPAPFELILEKGDIDLADLSFEIQMQIKTDPKITKSRAAIMRRRIEIAKRLVIPMSLLGYSAKPEGMFQKIVVTQECMQDALDLAEILEESSYNFIFGAPQYPDSVIKCGNAIIELLHDILKEKVYTSLTKVRKMTGCPWSTKNDKELVAYLAESGFACESKFTKNTLFVCKEGDAGKKGVDLAIAQIRLLRAAHPEYSTEMLFKSCECDKKTYNAAWDAVTEYEKCDAMEDAKTSIFYLDATIDTKATSA